MRGSDDQNGSLFSYVKLDERIPADGVEKQDISLFTSFISSLTVSGCSPAFVLAVRGTQVKSSSAWAMPRSVFQGAVLADMASAKSARRKSSSLTVPPSSRTTR